MLLMMDTSGEMSELRRVSSKFRISVRGFRWMPTQFPELFVCLFVLCCVVLGGGGCGGGERRIYLCIACTCLHTTPQPHNHHPHPLIHPSIHHPTPTPPPATHIHHDPHTDTTPPQTKQNKQTNKQTRPNTPTPTLPRTVAEDARHGGQRNLAGEGLVQPLRAILRQHLQDGQGRRVLGDVRHERQVLY
jgi:hypothetical protein